MTAEVSRRVRSLGQSIKLPTSRVLPLLLLVVVLPLVAAVPLGKPEDVGLSSDRLHRIDEVIQRAIDAKQIAGAVTIVSRRNRIAHFEAQGYTDLESKAADAQGRDLPDGVDVEAGHERGHPHAPRGRQGATERSGLDIDSRVQGHQSRDGAADRIRAGHDVNRRCGDNSARRRPRPRTWCGDAAGGHARAGVSADHRQGPADAYLRPRERRRRFARREPDCAARYQEHARALRSEAWCGAARFSAGHRVALQLARRHGDTRPHRRSGVGDDVRSVPEDAFVRPVGHEGHGVLPAR